MAGPSPAGLRKLSEYEPRVAAALRSHGSASLALREAGQSARYAAAAAALLWTAHRAMPWCVPGAGEAVT